MLDLNTKTYKRSESVVFLKVKETWGEFSNMHAMPLNVNGIRILTSEALYQALRYPRFGALVNMSFQLGVDGLLGFKNSLALMEEGKYTFAADNMLKSKWAEQTPGRAKRIAAQIRTGVWQ